MNLSFFMKNIGQRTTKPEPRTGMAIIMALVILMTSACGNAQPDRQDKNDSRQTSTQMEVATDVYANTLLKYVDEDGMVDYRALRAGRQSLDLYNRSLATLDPKAYESWNDETKIAFWINAYNGLTLQAIIDHYPIKKGGLISGLRFPENSIRQIPGVWDELKFTVMCKPMTLNDIEHETLRKQFDEPRIHMALVCAAMGCPPLRNEPYTGDDLDAQLEDQSKIFLGNPGKFRIDRGSNTVFMSSIFKWFGSDFANKYRTGEFRQTNEDVRPVLEFISRHLSSPDAQFLKDQEYRIEYLDYDWSLNEQ